MSKMYPPWAEFVADHEPWPAQGSVWTYDGHDYTVLTKPAKLKLEAEEGLADCPMVVYCRHEDPANGKLDLMVFCRPLVDFRQMFKEK